MVREGSIFTGCERLTCAAALHEGRLPLKLFDFFSQFWDRFEEIGDEAVVSDTEDRRFWVLVYCDNHFRVFHASKMLDRARNANREIEFRSNDFPCLSNLEVIRNKTRVYRRTACSHRCAKSINQGFEIRREILSRFQTTAARDDDPCFG